MKLISELVHEESGAAMAEYAMLLALITVAVIGAVSLLRNGIISAFNRGASTLQAASK
jgi:pilus assembly protein Flp/PilA